MKITINVDETVNETSLLLTCKELTPEVEKLIAVEFNIIYYDRALCFLTGSEMIHALIFSFFINNNFRFCPFIVIFTN